MKLSLLAELYQSVGRTFELVSERRPFNDVLRHYVDLADDTLALIRDARSATLYPGSQLFSSVQFKLAQRDDLPGGRVTLVQFFVRPHSLTLRDLMTVFGHWHAASTPAPRAVARFDAYRVCNRSRFSLSAEFVGSDGMLRTDETPLRVFITLRDATQTDSTQGTSGERAATLACTHASRNQSAA